MLQANKYRLIAPIFGNKVYETTSLLAGAKKCFEELGDFKTPYFSILDLDTNKVYNFGIPRYINNYNDISELKQDISLLEKRLDKLETPILNVSNIPVKNMGIGESLSRDMELYKQKIQQKGEFDDETSCIVN